MKQYLKSKLNDLESDVSNALVDNGYTSYICDAISECADGYIDVYTSDLKNWGRDHFDEIEEAINEYGWDGCGKDLTRAIMMAQYNAYSQEAYDELDEIIENYAINVILDNFDDYEQYLNEDNIDDIIDGLNFDNNDRFDDIRDYVFDKLNELVPSNEDDLD